MEVRRVRFERRKACRNLEEVWTVHFDHLKACRKFVNVRKVCFEHRSACRKFVGASLSEPHTSVTALRTCVCMLACLRPCTVKFK